MLGLATGSTPLQGLRAAARSPRSGRGQLRAGAHLQPRRVLDLPAHPQNTATSCASTCSRAWTSRWSTPFFPVRGQDLRRRCQNTARIVDEGGSNIQLLGMGRNGHIGFNEPTSSLASRTRIKTLAERTLTDNALLQRGETQPVLAVTMGIGTILEAKRILIQITGEKKAEAVRRVVEARPSFFPGSALQLHAHVEAARRPPRRGAPAHARLLRPDPRLRARARP
ncbi:MAG: 6-phosphogluconolactonase [Planctomycetota bacterium]